jgi:hypothetical protein
MKNITLIAGLLLFSYTLFSQVGIGTTAPTGALEVSAVLPSPSTQMAGFVPPTVSLSATNSTLTTTGGISVVNADTGGVPTIGTLVYNRNTSAPGANQVTPGYYYYNGSNWEKMATSGQSSTTYFTTAGVTIPNNTTTFTALQGFPITVNFTAETFIFVSGAVGVSVNGNGNGNANAATDVLLYVDNAILPNGCYQKVYTTSSGNAPYNYASFSQTLALPAGEHTIGLAAGNNSGSSVTVGGTASSVLQGELTITVLKK